MGKVYFDDLSTTWRAFERMAGDAPAVARAIMEHGAAEMIEDWRETISDDGLIDTGAMNDSVALIGKPKQVNGVWEVTVAPTGKDARGTRNAEKAAILNYGTSSIKAYHFIDKIMKKAEAALPEIAQAIMDKYNESGVIPAANPQSLKAIRKSTKKG